MSVINTMLKDLDKRQQAHSLDTLPVPDMQYVAAAPNGFSRRLPWVLLLLLSVCGMIGATIAWQKLIVLAQDKTQLEQDLQQAQRSTTELVAQERALTQSVEPVLTNYQNVAAEKPLSQQSEVATTEINSSLLTANASTHAKTNISSAAANGDDAGINADIKSTEPKNTELKNTLTTRDVSDGGARQSTEADPSPIAGAMAVTEVKLTPAALAQKRFALGQTAQNEGQLAQAQEYFSEAIRLDPSLHQARQHLAALYYGQGRLGDADDTLAQGRVLYPEHVDYALLQARVYEASGAIDKALAVLTTIPDEHELAVQKWTMQSHLAQQVQQFTLAEQSYRQLARVEPNQAKWWMGLAYALDSQQEFLLAKQAYRQALALNGLSASAIAFIDQRLAQLGDVE